MRKKPASSERRDPIFAELDRRIANDKTIGSTRMRRAHKSLVREHRAEMLRRAREGRG